MKKKREEEEVKESLLAGTEWRGIAQPRPFITKLCHGQQRKKLQQEN